MPTAPSAPASATTRLASRPLRWWTAAVLALLIGYADLWRGGVVVAPALLVLAYVVLIPVAVLRR